MALVKARAVPVADQTCRMKLRAALLGAAAALLIADAIVFAALWGNAVPGENFIYDHVALAVLLWLTFPVAVLILLVLGLLALVRRFANRNASPSAS
jgi:hypothetical protein